MSWRNTSSHGAETTLVKRALTGAGYKGVKVGHDRGTAWGWLRCKVEVPKPSDCRCAENEKEGRYGNCTPCHTLWNQEYEKLSKFLMGVTGRSGDYGGCINIDVTLA